MDHPVTTNTNALQSGHKLRITSKSGVWTTEPVEVDGMIIKGVGFSPGQALDAIRVALATSRYDQIQNYV